MDTTKIGAMDHLHLFMNLFRRGDWIKAQFRQQEEAFIETCEAHLIAAGLRPPGWLRDVPGGNSDVPFVQEPGREKLIYGNLVVPSSHNNIPSPKLAFLDSLLTERGNDDFESHTHFIDTGIEQGNLLDTPQEDSVVEPLVITARPRSRQRDLETRQGNNAKHLEDGTFDHGFTGRVAFSGSSPLMHDSLKESVQLEIGGATQFNESNTRDAPSEMSVRAMDGLAVSAILQTSKAGLSECIPDSISLRHGHSKRHAIVSQLPEDTSLAQPKQLLDGIGCMLNKHSTTLELAKINSDFPTFEASTTLEYVPTDSMKDHASPVSSTVEGKFLNEIQKVTSSPQMMNTLPHDGEEGGLSTLSVETPNAVSLQSEVFFKDKEAAIAAYAVPRDIIVRPLLMGDVADGFHSNSSNIHMENFQTELNSTQHTPNPPSSMYISAQLEREHALVTDFITSDTRKAPVSHENLISPEAHDGKDNVARIKDLSEEDDLQQVLISSSMETQNASADVRYNLRSSIGLVQDSTLKSAELNAAECSRRSQRSSHAYKLTWPQRRRMKVRSTNVLHTSPRLRSKENKYARRESDKTYNRSGFSHEVIGELQPSPMASSLAIGLSNNEIEAHSLEQHGKNVAGLRDLSEEDDAQQVLIPSSTETKNASADAKHNLRSSIRLVEDSTLKPAEINAAECRRRSKGRSNHADEFTWPKRIRMTGRSTNVFATSPRLRCKKERRFARKESDKTYNSRSEFSHETINELQTSPITSSMVIGMSSNDIEGHSLEQDGRNVAHIRILGEKDDQQVLASSSTESQDASADERYNLRSSIRSVKDSSLESAEVNAAECWRRSKLRSNHAYTWPKRRRMKGQSTNVFATSPRLRSQEHIYARRESDWTYNNMLEFSPEAINELQPLLNTNSSVICVPPTEIKGHSLEKFGRNVIATVEVDSCLSREDMELAMPPSHEYLHNNPVLEQTFDEAMNCPISGSSDHFNMDLHRQKDRLDLLIAGTSHECKRDSISEDNNDSLERIIHDPCGDVLRHASFSSVQHGDNLLGHDDIMPELEGFSIGLSSVLDDGNIPKDTTTFSHPDIRNVTNERASLLEKLYISCSNISPVSRPSMKYKIHDVADVYHPLPIGMLEQIQLGNYFHASGEMEHNIGEEEEEELTGSNGKSQLTFDDLSSHRQHSQSLDCLNLTSLCEAKRPPPSPPVGKVIQRTFTEKRGNSEKLNPELVCFRIDENSPITDEYSHLEGYMEKSKADCRLLETKTTDKQALIDFSLYQDLPTSIAAVEEFQDRNSLNSVCTEVCSTSQLEDDYAGSKAKNCNKENAAYSIRRNMTGKTTDSASSKLKISETSKQKKKSRIASGLKPKNIITNVSSFIPHVQQKQQPTLSFAGRPVIKVKALEEAEVQKRIEEKKQNERKMRKEASKIEREKLGHENAKQLEFRRKHEEEERKRKEANLAARKRQREDEKNKKERKRKCFEEAKKPQRNQIEKQHAKEVKEPRHKAADEKHQRNKCSAGEAKQLITPEKGSEQVGYKKETACETDVGRPATSNLKERFFHKKISCAEKKAMISTEEMQNRIQEGISVYDGSQDINSYEISPYKSSDVEDEDDDIMRRNKYIPPWAREKALDDLLRSVGNSVPEIFSQKSSFNVAEVLVPRTPRRPI